MDPERKSARDAIVELLGTLPEVVSNYAIGGPLIAAGYDQDELVNALYGLQSDGRIELLMANGLRQIRAAPAK